MQAAFAQADKHGDSMPDDKKGMLFCKKAKMPGHIEDFIMMATQGSRKFSAMFPVIRQLARRPNTDSGGTFATVNLHDSESTESADEVNIREVESNVGTSDADSEDGQFILLDQEQYDAIFLNEEAIEEEDRNESLEVYFGHRKEKKSGFRRNYKATRQKLLDDRLNRGFRDKRQSSTKAPKASDRKLPSFSQFRPKARFRSKPYTLEEKSLQRVVVGSALPNFKNVRTATIAEN